MTAKTKQLSGTKECLVEDFTTYHWVIIVFTRRNTIVGTADAILTYDVNSACNCVRFVTFSV